MYLKETYMAPKTFAQRQQQGNQPFKYSAWFLLLIVFFKYLLLGYFMYEEACVDLKAALYWGLYCCKFWHKNFNIYCNWISATSMDYRHPWPTNDARYRSIRTRLFLILWATDKLLLFLDFVAVWTVLRCKSQWLAVWTLSSIFGYGKILTASGRETWYDQMYFAPCFYGHRLYLLSNVLLRFYWFDQFSSFSRPPAPLVLLCAA